VITPAPTGKPPDSRKEDIVTKHGKRIVVIIFSILAGDAIPVIIQNGIDPDKQFYTIVGLTLPYTGALVLIFLVLAKSSQHEHPYGRMMLCGLILLLGFAAGAQFHWGISNAEYNQAMQRMDQLNHTPYGHQQKPAPQQLANDISVLIQFYFHKYGLPLFVAATLAAIVITWNILKWTQQTAASDHGK
jgi:hypothetical protein